MTSTTAGPVRVALIGFGGSARGIHLPLIRAVDDLVLVAVVPTSDRARADAESMGLPVMPTVESLADRGVEVGVVATPDIAHVEYADAALEAGLDVVVDKPVAPTVAGAEHLARVAERVGRRVIPFQNRRWDGDFLTVQRLLTERAVGSPLRFESRITRWSPRVGPNWRDQRREGMLDGRLADLGSHLADQAHVLFGGVDEVYAEIGALRPGAVANDDCFVALRHTSGVLAHLHMSALSAARLPRMRLQGLDAAYVKYGGDPQQDALGAGADPRAADWGLEDASEAGVLTTADAERAVTTERGDWTRFYRAVAAMRRGGAPPPVGIGEALAVLRMLEAAETSAREHTVVRPV